MEPEQQPTPGGSLLRNVALAIAVVYVLISLYFLVGLQGQLHDLQARLKASENKQEELSGSLKKARSDFEDSTAAVAQQVGMTQKQLAARTAELHRQQRATESHLAQAQQATEQQIGAVTGQVAGVKTDVGGVKTDLATTRQDLAATQAKLERAIGDLGMQSGLIARTRDELEVLKHKGDRNYYEFSLQKGARTPVSNISLKLKKVDAKRGKFSLDVIADDRVIEKKDRTLNEPLQFYTGRERMLYELVVFTAEKNHVSGYLATPKQQAVAQ